MRDRLTGYIQKVYDFNFKMLESLTIRPNGFKYEYAGVKLDIFPTAIDYTSGNGKTIQVKWEIHERKVVNLSCPTEIESPLAVVLNEYLLTGE